MPDYPKARKTAKDLLKKYNITNAPIDPEAIAEGEGINVIYADFKPEVATEISGLYDFETRTIIINKDIAANRKTFTIAHELAHALMHEEYASSENYTVMPRSNHHVAKPKEEKEADVFAACLLVPVNMLKNYIHLASTSELAKAFAVSPEVIINQSKYI